MDEIEMLKDRIKELEQELEEERESKKWILDHAFDAYDALRKVV